MKCIIYGLILSLFVSCNISVSMDRSALVKETQFLLCSIFGLYLAKYTIENRISIANGFVSIIDGLKSFFSKPEKRIIDGQNSIISTNFCETQDEKQQLQPRTIVPRVDAGSLNSLTPEKLQKLTKERREKQKKEKKEKVECLTELHEACYDNDVQRVRSLLQNGDSDINVVCKGPTSWNSEDKIDKIRGRTALHIACEQQHKEIIDLLLACKNIDVSLMDSLYFAVKHQDQDLVAKLINHPTMKFSNHYALGIACEKRYIDNVELLLACNVNDCMNINAGDMSPLVRVCKKIQSCEIKIEVLEALLKYELSDIGPLYRYFHSSILAHYYHTLSQLNKKKSSIKGKIQQKRKRCDALLDILQLLLNNPYVTLNVLSRNQERVFHLASCNAEALQLLWQKNISQENANQWSINTQDNRRETALHCAAKAGNKEAFFLLLSYGADIAIPSTDGNTPFTLLCSRQVGAIRSKIACPHYQDLIEGVLCSQEIHISEDVLSQCLIGSILGHEYNYYLPELLLAHGANPNKQCQYGWSPLLKAAWWGNVYLLNLFIDSYGGDITQQYNNSQTAFYLAFMREAIKTPCEITGFNNLSIEHKRAFVRKELHILMDGYLKDIFFNGCDAVSSRSIDLFNSFVNNCINYVGDEKYIRTLFYKSCARAQERRSNFFASKFQCMYSTDGICHGNDSVCSHCKNYIQYNEMIVHALSRHVAVQNVDTQIALIYKDSPITYYELPEEEKKEQKEIVQELMYAEKIGAVRNVALTILPPSVFGEAVSEKLWPKSVG